MSKKNVTLKNKIKLLIVYLIQLFKLTRTADAKSGSTGTGCDSAFFGAFSCREAGAIVAGSCRALGIWEPHDRENR